MNQTRNRAAENQLLMRITSYVWKLALTVSYIVTQFARESFGICRFRGSCMREYDLIWLTLGISKITVKQFAREDFVFAPCLRDHFAQ